MRVLDLDLDCFVEGTTHLSNDGGDRPDNEQHPPWSEGRFRDFLESRCGLSTSNRTRGRILQRHEEAFGYWRELIDNGTLKTPFSLTHVDAHSDMGLGEKSWIYIMSRFLFLKEEDRPHPENVSEFLTSGSYLAFALACGWISDLTFVHHAEWPDYDDLMRYYFKDNDIHSGFIQLKAYSHIDIKVFDYVCSNPPTRTEPEIPFTLCPVEDYRSASAFEIATLCQSPGFTPESADSLLDVFREYILES